MEDKTEKMRVERAGGQRVKVCFSVEFQTYRVRRPEVGEEGVQGCFRQRSSAWP
jgi:hypothetical protein